MKSPAAPTAGELQRLRELVPEFAWIRDGELRERCERTWLRALREGGFSVEDVQRIPNSLLTKDPVPFAVSKRAVARMCAVMWDTLHDTYGERLKADRDVLVAGALLADVGKFLEYTCKDGKWGKSETGRHLRHPFTGVALARAEGVPDAVLHVIAAHSKEGDPYPRSPECIIFHHADFTDFELLG